MKFLSLTLIVLVLTAVVAAQVPSSAPSSVPSTDPAPQTARTGPVTLPTTESDTQPATQVSTTNPTTGPTGGPSEYSTSGPAYRSFSSYSSGRRDFFRPEGPGTTLPANNPLFNPKPYPRQYSAMLSRSIFIKGRQWVPDGGSVRDRSARPAFTTTTSTTPPPSSSFAEGMLVFNGASDADGKMVAFIENTGMNQISRYHVGDPVGQGAPGRIAAITLDSLDYSVGPRMTHVRLGQNLNGIDVPIITTQPVIETYGSSAGSSGTTQPASGTTSSGTAISDIERRMREKRLKELGQ